MLSEYTYKVSRDGYSWWATPELNGSTLSWVGEDYRYGLRKEWSGQLAFYNNPKTGSQDYSLIYAISDPSIEFSIDVYKNGLLYWSGTFCLYDCRFDTDKNVAYVTPHADDVYASIEEAKDKEENILFWNLSRATVHSQKDYYEIETIYDIDTTASVPATIVGEQLSTYHVKVTEDYTDVGTQTNPLFERVRTYKRDVVYTAVGASAPATFYADPVDPVVYVGGVMVANKWVRPYLNLNYLTTPFVKNATTFSITQVIYDDEEYPRCMFLNSIIEKFADIYSLGYKSTFFEDAINPVTGDSPSPTANILVGQKSDIKRPSASNHATKGMMSFGGLMEILYNMFQVRWFIESYTTPSGTTGNRLRIEHETYFAKQVGINVCSGKYLPYTKSMNRYSYGDSSPRYETWEFMEAGGVDFIGEPIEYNTVRGTKRNDVSYALSNVTTDLELIQNKTDSISDEGWVFFATSYSGGYNVINETGRLSNYDIVNGHLSISSLQHNYWRHNRHMPTGLMNKAQTTFLSVRKKKEQDELTIPIIEPVDTNKLIETELGDGEIVSAVEDFSTDTLKIKLIYA